jgi:hypothetical protein
MSLLVFEISDTRFASVGKCKSVIIKYWPDLNYFSITATLGFVAMLLVATYHSWDFTQRGHQSREISKQFVKYSD